MKLLKFDKGAIIFRFMVEVRQSSAEQRRVDTQPPPGNHIGSERHYVQNKVNAMLYSDAKNTDSGKNDKLVTDVKPKVPEKLPKPVDPTLESGETRLEQAEAKNPLAPVGASVEVGASVAALVTIISASNPLAALAYGGVGWYAGKKLNEHNKWGKRYAEEVGALGGVIIAPHLASGILKFLGTFNNAWLGPHIALAMGLALLGSNLGKKISKSKWAGFAGAIGGMAASFGISSLGFTSAVVSAIPSLGISAGVLPAALSLGAVTGAGVGALYALGRMQTYVWGLKKSGSIPRNVMRGIVGIPGIPIGLAKNLISGTWNATRQAVAANVDGAKRIATGSSAVVNAVAAPVWLPVRTAARFISGVVAGPAKGFQKSGLSPDGKSSLPNKIGSAITYAPGRIARVPFDIGSWLWKKNDAAH